MRRVVELGIHVVPRSTGSCALMTSTLDHESVNDPVKPESVVEADFGQADAVLTRDPGLIHYAQAVVLPGEGAVLDCVKKLESYTFAIIATIIAMVPCISPCCIVGLPIGIWALVVLNKPEVKGAFS